MKKCIRLVVLTIMFSMFLCTGFSAVSVTYHVSEMKLDITIPSDYSVITRETSEYDPVFGQLGTTRADVMRHFEAQNIYLNAILNSAQEEIVVTMTDNNVPDINTLNNTYMEEVVSGISKMYAEMGLEISDYDVYQRDTVKFVKIYYFDTKNSVFGLQYYTIYKNKAMNFTLRSTNVAITPEHEEKMKNIVDSLKFDSVTPNSLVTNEKVVYVVWGVLGLTIVVLIALIFGIIKKKKGVKKVLPEVKKVNAPQTAGERVVFISYKSEEFDIALSTRQVLEDNGFSCWLAPLSIPAGGDYGIEIPKAIAECKVFLLLLSEASQESEWVPKELGLAINEKKYIIPFHIDDSEIVEPFRFSLINNRQIEAYQRIEAAYSELLLMLKNVLSAE